MQVQPINNNYNKPSFGILKVQATEKALESQPIDFLYHMIAIKDELKNIKDIHAVLDKNCNMFLTITKNGETKSYYYDKGYTCFRDKNHFIDKLYGVNEILEPLKPSLTIRQQIIKLFKTDEPDGYTALTKLLDKNCTDDLSIVCTNEQSLKEEEILKIIKPTNAKYILGSKSDLIEKLIN